MPFKLTKDETARVEALADMLDSRFQDLCDAVTAYNEAVSEARELAEEIAQRAADEWGEKSEKWQEGERGEAAHEWVDAWGCASFEEVDEPGENAGEALRNLPSEMEG